MQRYYHKGAFFQEDDIFQRDFSAPTGEDKLDISKLHKILQVKKFGHSGRTKWTHLLNEDTTGKGNQWTLIDPLCEKYKRMAGMDALIVLLQNQRGARR
ncbi:unnamed protein product [Arabis nemorensis]|uniref:Micro-fibrillar-associated protein 1 C-terminal domain-containing protein n=1 Tax=Arabis nemorensis TaxID=586526 RepID=A0A565BD67_9BRAS|nr:unnamed protein product [Arabis nemorensis]